MFIFKADKKWVFILHTVIFVLNVGKINCRSYHERGRNASQEDEGKMTVYTEGGAEKHPNHLN